jgi:hypothetical protein
MNASASLTFPEPAVLASWYSQLLPLNPHAIWVGHLLVHRVEALVRTEQSRPIDPPVRAVLGALAERAQDISSLEKRLGLQRQFLFQVLRELSAMGLASDRPSGWEVTEAGSHAHLSGHCLQPTYKRRTFHFLCLPNASPIYVSLTTSAAELWTGSVPSQFDPGLLNQCARQSETWKTRSGFPKEVVQVVAPDDPLLLAAAWQKVVVSQPLQHSAVLVACGKSDEESLRAFTYRRDAWGLDTSQPAFSFGREWRETIPKLAAEVPAETLQNAWREWCEGKGISPADTNACRLEVEGCALHVFASPGIVSRVGDKERKWLLLGDETIRRALEVKVSPA